MPRNPLRKKTTIRDVASRAGVSVGTVSRVINNKEGIRPSTRQKVLQVMRELRYQPEMAARELSFGSGTLIGLNESPAIHQGRLKGPFFNMFFQTLLEEAFKAGFRVREIPPAHNGLPAQLPDAMVVLGAHAADPRLDYLDQSGIPYVLIGQGDSPCWVSGDDISGGYQAGRHLVKLGHTQILHMTGNMEDQVNQDRYKGFRKALSESGCSHSEALHVSGLFTPLESYRAMVRFLREKNCAFTAVFAGSDEIAHGIRAALEDKGRRIPGDISLVGYDDLPGLSHDLTTIHQDIPLLASNALTLLKEQMEGKKGRSILQPVQLIARQTTSRKV